jgi:hypothetical protein
VNAPNTPGAEITLAGPYHNVQGGSGLASTVSAGDYTAAKCRKCKVVAAPAHVTDAGKTGALAVWCENHCPTCVAFRKRQVAA